MSACVISGLAVGTPLHAATYNTVTDFSLSANLSTGIAAAVTTDPVVTLTAPIPSVAAESGNDAEFLLTLSSALTSDLIVNYTVKGTATNGTDYVLLKGTKKIKAGKTSKLIKVIPEGDLGGAAKKTVVLTLEPGTGYAVGTTGKVKVKITAPSHIIILP